MASTRNQATNRTEVTDLYQTADRSVEAEPRFQEDDEIPIGMPPGDNSVHNVNTIVQPTIPVQAAIRRLKATNKD